MKFDVITIFPRMVQAGLAEGCGESGHRAAAARCGGTRPSDFTTDRHRSVDDMPYGGGPGMVMKVEPIVEGGGVRSQQSR
jgi:tRNA (guanine37-N1)-methyltransferase